MKKILCPTDFSDAAHGAIAYAAKLAQQMGAELTLFHVRSLFDIMPTDLFTGKRDTMDLAAHELDAESRQVSRAFRIPCFGEVVSSIRPLSIAISDRARRCDLVVMGSNGPSDLYQLLTGSNTYNTIVQTETPLLVIPEGCAYREISSITYAFNYLKEATLPITPLSRFARSLGATITVLQVLENDHREAFAEVLHDIQCTIKRISRPGIPLEFETLHSNNIAGTIDEHIKDTGADLLALCAIHRGLVERLFHRSVIREMSELSEYPLFIFHE